MSCLLCDPVRERQGAWIWTQKSIYAAWFSKHGARPTACLPPRMIRDNFTWSCVELGPQSQRGSNDISVCCSSEATRIPRGWMGQFRSRSEDKLIRELWESVSIKREPGFNCPCHGFLWTRVNAVSNIFLTFSCVFLLTGQERLLSLTLLFPIWRHGSVHNKCFISCKALPPPTPQQKSQLALGCFVPQCMRSGTSAYPKCRCQGRLSAYLIWHVTWQTDLGTRQEMKITLLCSIFLKLNGFSQCFFCCICDQTDCLGAWVWDVKAMIWFTVLCVVVTNGFYSLVSKITDLEVTSLEVAATSKQS